MDTNILLYILCSFFIASFLKGVTGLGFSTICLGILGTFIEPKLSIPLVIFPSLASNILVMLDAGHFQEAIKKFWFLYLWAIPGLILGLFFLSSIESQVSRAVLGCVLFAYGIFGLLKPNFLISPGISRWLFAPVGLTTGIINGMTGSQIMPILPFLLSLNLPKEILVQAINISFTTSSVIVLMGLSKLGYLNWQILGVSLLGIMIVFLGIKSGGKIRRRISEKMFKKMVLVLLIGLGLNLILSF